MSHSMRSIPSVYSQVSTGRSLSQKPRNLRYEKKAPWYRKPLLRNHKSIPIQNAALTTAVFSLSLSIFCIITNVFDVYCLTMVAPGVSHYGHYFISYEFVYVGNMHVRNALMIFAIFSTLGGLIVMVTSILLLVALRNHATNIGQLYQKEYERKMVPWLWSFAVFIILRLFALLFFAIVNDMMFAYNIVMVVFWSIFCVLSAYGWLLIHTCYLEFINITKLEDLAHLRLDTMASLHASTTMQTLASSRPTTPHSTVSTMPVG